MRIQELRELSFKTYMPLVYPTFFLMRLSVASVVFVSGAPQMQGFGNARFFAEILPEACAGVEISA